MEENYGDSEVNDMNNNGSFLYALIGECLEKKVESRPSMEKIIDKYVEKYQEDDFWKILYFIICNWIKCHLLMKINLPLF